MHCRVVRSKLDPNRIEESVKKWEEILLTTIKKQPGFAGHTAIVNRKTGDAITVTYWDSEKALQDSQTKLLPIAQKYMQSVGAELVEQTECEVAVLERIQPLKVGAATRTTTLQADPSKVDEGIAAFKEKVVPVIKQQQGSRTAFFFVDRKSGKVFAGSSWDSQKELEKSEEKITSLREETVKKTGGTNPKVEAFEIVSAEVLATAPTRR